MLQKWTTAIIALALFPISFAATQVQLGNTTLTGTFDFLTGLEFFGGIPFAEPPVGSLRLKPPVLKTSLNVSTFDATNFGPRCLQDGTDPMSEDCLTINVRRPGGLTVNDSVPVMVWIYGGGFTAGTGAMYDGVTFARQSWARGTPIIYVNFNYRLGALGFPQGQEAASRGALNLGLKDQIAALQWVQHNIKAFGGDKSKVTVFGESAGAVSIGIHFLNPSFSNLARAGIMESGSAGTTLLFPGGHRQEDWENFVSAVPACASIASSTNTFDCLRTADAESLRQGMATSLVETDELFPWVPVLDGADGVFPDYPSRLYESGHYAHIPFIAGTNLDEGTVFTPQTINSTQTIGEGIIANYTPSLRSPGALEAAADELLTLYPDVPAVGSPYNTGNNTFGLSSQYKRLASLYGDLLFQANRRLWIQSATAAGVKTFGYLFEDRPLIFPAKFGSSHGLDVLYLYGGIETVLLGALPPSLVLAAQMVDYWISFAVSLDPNDGKGTPRPQWPRYTLQDKSLMHLTGWSSAVIPDTYREEQINAINRDPLLFHH